MAELYRYNCAACGGVLNIDSDQEILDCPFCGTQLDLVEYHRRDILCQAELCLKRQEFKSAYERYKDLYDKDPGNFEAVRGLILCAGEIPVKDDLTNPKKLIRHDLEYAIVILVRLSDNCSGQAYFKKLDEIFRLSIDLQKLTKERGKNAKLTAKQIQDLGNSGDSFFDRRFNRIASDGAKNADLINIRIRETEKKFSSACDELRSLEPKAPKNVTYSAEMNSNKVVTDTEALTDISCLNCGGRLMMDLKRSLCECRSCGVAYGTSLFFGHPDVKAKEALVNHDYSEADQRYSYMLMLDPHDFAALRGRVLCAAKWSSPKVELGISSFWVNNLRSRVKYALDKAHDEDKPYFQKYNEMLYVYSDILSYDNKLKPLKKQHKDLIYKRDHIVVDYDPYEDVRELYARDSINNTISDLEKQIWWIEKDRNRYLDKVCFICDQIKEMDTKWLLRNAQVQTDSEKTNNHECVNEKEQEDH